MKRNVFVAILLSLVLLGRLGVAWADESGIGARLVFIGDIMAHATQLEAASGDRGYDFSPQFRRILPLFHDALVIGNLETVFAGEEAKYTGYPEFNTPDELAGTLARAGVQVLTLANNHILDRRESGAARTLEVLDRAGLLWTGVATKSDDLHSPLVVDYEGMRIAVLNYTYGSNNPPTKNPVSADVLLNFISPEAVESGLARARTLSPDLTVACFHWGNEYVFEPTKRDRSIAEICLQNGVDLVIGTHPHVLQPLEIRQSEAGERSPALVAWSLGNFVSYQRTLPRERSVILAVDVEKRAGGGAAIKRVSVAPTWVSARWQEGRRRIEVVYAGMGGPFNHGGLPAAELKKARSAGDLALEFLGAKGDPDAAGFYTLWDSSSPDVLPAPGRKKPQ